MKEKYLIDVNIFIGAFRKDMPHHESCTLFVQQAFSSHYAHTTFQDLSAVIRICTHHKNFKPPSQRKDIEAFIQSLLSHPSLTIIAPTQDTWNIFTNLCQKTDVIGNDIPDALLASLAIEQNLTLVSLDEGFARFTPFGLRWKKPQHC